MAELTVGGSIHLGQALAGLMEADDLMPGDQASYEVCKAIYLYHVLGSKMVDAPIKQAQAQGRDITVPNSPEARVVEQFQRTWDAMGCDNIIQQLASTARIYGIGSVVYGAPGYKSTSRIDPWRLAGLNLYFNVLDPLNTAGSLVLGIDPTQPDFQKWSAVTAAGEPYNPSRTCVLMNERPVYLAYTSSAYGYSGRSVYQRALYPLKSFVQTMITDDMVAQKAGLLIVMMKQVGSIVDRIQAGFGALKRQMLKGGRTGNVLQVGPDDKVETLNMQNLDGAFGAARANILKNIATAADMPAVMLENETLTQGFGEGSEDAKIIAAYVDSVRDWMRPAYDFMDEIVMHRAWSEDFYRTIQAEFPQAYGSMEYKTAFYQWKNSFNAAWPSLLQEPPSELVKVDEVKLKSIVSLLQVLGEMCDPANKAEVVKWACANVNELKLMFPNPLDLDFDALVEWAEEQAQQAQEAAEAKAAGQDATKPSKPTGLAA